MKVRTEATLFAKALKTVATAARWVDHMPVLSGVRIEAAEGHTVTLTCTDTELVVRQVMRAVVDEPGVAVIPAALLSAALARTEGMVTLSSTDDGIEMAASYGSAKLRSLKAEEWPRLARPTGVTCQVEALGELPSFPAWISKTGKISMRGIHLHAMPDMLRIVATDSYRILRWQTAAQCEGEARCTLPTSGWAAIKPLLEEGATLTFADRALSVVNDSGAVLSTLIAEEYPTYWKLTDENGYPTKVSVDIESGALMAALQRCVSFANDDTFEAKLTIGDGGIGIETTSGKFESSLVERVEGEVEGEPLVVTFNAASFIDLLKAVEAEQVKLVFTGHNRPVYLRDEHTVALLMPFVR